LGFPWGGGGAFFFFPGVALGETLCFFVWALGPAFFFPGRVFGPGAPRGEEQKAWGLWGNPNPGGKGGKKPAPGVLIFLFSKKKGGGPSFGGKKTLGLFWGLGGGGNSLGVFPPPKLGGAPGLIGGLGLGFLLAKKAPGCGGGGFFFHPFLVF